MQYVDHEDYGTEYMVGRVSRSDMYKNSGNVRSGGHPLRPYIERPEIPQADSAIKRGIRRMSKAHRAPAKRVQHAENLRNRNVKIEDGKKGRGA